jgi:hypothetical protein
MKLFVVAMSLVLGTLAMAQTGAAAPAEAKVDKKAAKMECLKENPKLKGKELSACVKGKSK